MKLRKAEEKDWKAIQKLDNKLFIHDSDFDFTINMDYPFSKDGENYYKNATKNKKYKAFVIENNKDIIIAFVIFHVGEDYAYRKGLKQKVFLDNIYIDEEYRKQGLGKQLFQEIEKFAKENNIKRLTVLVHANSKNAIRFYNKVGLKDYTLELEKDL